MSSAQAVHANLRRRIEEEYRQRTPGSRVLHEQAQRYLPGGDTRYGVNFSPYPTYIASGQGSYLYDVDGNALLDFTNNATSLIHGHAHPRIIEAIQAQASRGTAWSAPNEHQLLLAQMLCERVPSLERVRFCNSGTEANMQAIKAARAFTGRDKILKMDGAYHGTYEGTEFEVDSGLPKPAMRGIPRNAADNVLVAPFNDKNAAAELIRQYRHEMAATVVTPIMTRDGLILPTDGYLAALRDVTRECGVILIFDEVITLRMDVGGAQAHFEVVPDLTAMGKIIGGGLPVGAFGGRADILDQLFSGSPPPVAHAGTFNGNPLTMAAGIATLELLTPAEHQRLGEMGRFLRQRFQQVINQLNLPFEVRHACSLVSLDYSALGESALATGLLSLLTLALLNRGVKAYSLFAISTVMVESEMERAANALHDALKELRPAMRLLLSRRPG